MSLAALEATLMLHRDMPERVPVQRMLGQTEAVLQQRAERLRTMLGSGTVERTEAFAAAVRCPKNASRAARVALQPQIGAEEAAALLRSCDPPVIGRINDGRLLLDMLTVSDDELPELAAAAEDGARVTRLVLGVIGHVDHGKTALVRALTGTDTDRLPRRRSAAFPSRSASRT